MQARSSHFQSTAPRGAPSSFNLIKSMASYIQADPVFGDGVVLTWIAGQTVGFGALYALLKQGAGAERDYLVLFAT